MDEDDRPGRPPISRATLADRVYEALRDELLEGRTPPGQFVREQDVSESYGVSRTPVREALGRLASEGFLERIPHRGFRVPEEPFSRLLDLYPIVAVLEVLAGRLAFPELEAEHLERLREVNLRMREALRRGEVEEAIEWNDRFHAAIVERSGNRSLVELLDDMRSQLHRLERWYYSYPERGHRSVREHDGIVEALEVGDIERALEIFEGNMKLTWTALLEETRRERKEG